MADSSSTGDKDALLADAAAKAADGAAGVGDVLSYLRAYYRHVAVEDLAAAGPERLAAIAIEQARFAAYRAFTRVYGLAPSDYQRQLRVRAARRLLIRGVSPAHAAAQAGFADQAHLTRWFRRYYGVTPGAYRAAASKEVS